MMWWDGNPLQPSLNADSTLFAPRELGGSGLAGETRGLQFLTNQLLILRHVVRISTGSTAEAHPLPVITIRLL